MRRADREIGDFNEILDVLRRADTMRLGLNGDPYPYVVPLSFGFEAMDGNRIAVYFHGAAEGLKHELIKRDARVCVEADIFHRYAARYDGGSCSITAEFESVIGYGTAETVAGAEAEHGMALMLGHCGHPDFKYDIAALNATKVYKVTLTAVMGKRRFI